MTSQTTRGRTGRPPVTSQAEILTAARALIDREGWERLTIRGLAAELGIGPTTLYRNVRNKQDLLLLLIDEYAAGVALPELPSDPRERIVAAFVTLRARLAAWPWAAEVLTVDGFMGRLGDPALRPVEAIVEAATAAGCGRRQAVDLFRSGWYLTVGEILVRARTARDREGRGLGPSSTAGSELPTLAAIGDSWASYAERDVYPDAIRALVDGMLADVD